MREKNCEIARVSRAKFIPKQSGLKYENKGFAAEAKIKAVFRAQIVKKRKGICRRFFEQKKAFPAERRGMRQKRILNLYFLQPHFLQQAFFAGAFLAAAFLAGAFFAATFLATAFLAGAFLAATFLTATFFAGAFLAATFLAGAFLATAFFTGAFFAATFLAGAFFTTFLAMISWCFFWLLLNCSRPKNQTRT